MLLMDVTPTESITSAVNSIISSVTSVVGLADIGTLVGALVGGTIAITLVWQFSRKAYSFVKRAITGRNAHL